MRSKRYSLHIDRSTSSGDIGLLARSTDDDLSAWNDRKPTFLPANKLRTDAKSSRSQPLKEAPEQDAKPSVASPSQNPSSTHPSCGNSGAALISEQWKNPSRASPAVRKGIFFIEPLEREAVKGTPRFGDLVKSCAWCNEEFDTKNNVDMYRGRPFCSSKCRDARIASDGYTKRQVGLEGNDGSTTKILRRNPNAQLGRCRSNISALDRAA